MAKIVHLKIANCIDCPNHEVVSDPDPYDSFCSDDVAVLCKASANTDRGTHWASGYLWPHRAITSSCRPYRTRNECEVPEWCPLEEAKPIHHTSEECAHGTIGPCSRCES